MSNLAWVASLLLAAPLLTGCLSFSTPPAKAIGALDLASILAPGALVETVQDGARVLWQGPLQSEQPFSIRFPAGVTRIDAALTKADDAPSSMALYNAQTGRIRCQPDRTESWFTPMKGVHRCAGTTVLDPYPSTWRVVSNFNGGTKGGAALAAGESLELLLSNAPLDGQAAQIRAASLSMPTFAELPTSVVQVPSSVDGAKLHVELTRPQTDAKVPTIIVSSPYNQATRVAGLRPENSTVADWVPRGYAVVSADVRGFALSEGCIEVWGPKEQQDQVDLVEWVAAQPWSNGKVGFYGQSYVGTTPVEAASHAPPHLTTIIAVAPVINAYEDWHFGGVPNGENTGSPAFYQYQDTGQFLDMATADADPQSLLDAIQQSQTGFCDASLFARANDPRAVYDDFYRERNFKTMAREVKASVFYTQGFYDTNVKSQMIPGWFDALDVPKKALFGDWVHQHPPRGDQELLFHAWFDQWLLGSDTGILETPAVEVRTNVDTLRSGPTWPPVESVTRTVGLDFAAKKLVLDAAGTGSAQYVSHPDPQTTPQAMTSLEVQGAPLTERVYLSGQLTLQLRMRIDGAANTHVYAELDDVAPDGTSRVLTFGMLNAAHNADHTTWMPIPPGETRSYVLPFLVTEYVLEPGHSLALKIRAASNRDWAGIPGAAPTAGAIVDGVSSSTAGSTSPPGLITIEGNGSAIVLPTLAAPGDVPAAQSAGPAPLAT